MTFLGLLKHGKSGAYKGVLGLDVFTCLSLKVHGTWYFNSVLTQEVLGLTVTHAGRLEYGTTSGVRVLHGCFIFCLLSDVASLFNLL